MGNLALLGVGAPPWDSDAQAYFAQLVPQPSYTWKTAVNTLVKQLKADGNWAELDRFWIHATEHQQNARVSVVNPTSPVITEVNSPVWAINRGYTGDGATTYLNSNFVPVNGVKFTQDSASAGVYVRTNSAATTFDMAAIGASYRFGIISRTAGNNMLVTLNVAVVTASSLFANADGRGLCVALRTGAANQGGYKNGASLGTDAKASAGRTSIAVFILAQNNNGVADSFSAREISISFFGSGAIDQATFYTAIQAFANTIGFAV